MLGATNSIHCGNSGNGNGIALCLGAIAVTGAVTTIVSGSIVLIGNTVHWLEKQGKCDDSFLNTQILNHNKTYLEQNGQLIELETNNK